MKGVYVADFETTTLVDDCRVWLWGLYEIHSETFNHGTTLESFFEYLLTLPTKTKLYFHNLKFDGEFLFYGLFKKNFKHSTERKLYDYEFSTLITHMGVFYAIHIKFPNKEFTIYDSLKIIPLPVKKISKSFDIAQLKGDIDYTKERPIGYTPDTEEVAYVRNDVEIVGKALKYFFTQKLTKMTQASNAFSDFKNIVGEKKFEKLFPSLNEIDAELRQSYKGGFTYVAPRFQNLLIDTGIVLDVNSLYPSVMYYSFLPYGEPILYEGQYEKDPLYNIYIQMFRCNFELKEGYLPTIQLKHNMGFMPTDYVTSSNGLDVTLCLTSVDLELFFEHYEVYNVDWFKGWKFKSTNTIFRDYIDKWGGIKEQCSIDGNEGLRTIAKLMMNALYGKFGLNPMIRSKIPTYVDEFVKYETGGQDERETIYIPVASFVTSYARKITIESGQKNFERFVYADTDSLHLLGSCDPIDINVHPHKLGFWKLEGNFNKARFLRAKSYIENMFLTVEEWSKLKKEQQGKWLFNDLTGVYEQIHVACAGLPTNLHTKITFDNFKNGMVIGGKLQHNRVKGGVVLKEIDFTIKI